MNNTTFHTGMCGPTSPVTRCVFSLGRGFFEGDGSVGNGGLVEKLFFEYETEDVPTFW